jgi:DNA-binding protein H-NS
MPKLSTEALKARIALLQKQLAAAESHKAPAIKKVKALMKKLGVTVHDLSGNDKTSVTEGRRRGRPPKASAQKNPKPTATRKVAIKYRDEKGNTWTGRGKTPRWLVEAEKIGRGRDTFKI